MMVEGQGGDPRITEDISILPSAKCSRALKASGSGWITGIESETVGRACVALGAGRRTKDESIDPGAGIVLSATVGDQTAEGEPLLTMYAANESCLDEAEAMLSQAIIISETQPSVQPLIHGQYSTRQ